MFGRQRFRATRNVFWRVSVALAFAICVAIGLIIAGTRSAQASENEDGYNFNKLPDGLGDSHSFDVSGMDRGELSRAFAGQLTVVAQAVSLCNAEPRKPTACATRKEIV